MITNAIQGRNLPVYGDGKNVRDWLYVEDHCDAIWTILQKGENGRSYNVGGNNEWANINIVKKICEVLGKLTPKPVSEFEKLIHYVTDRPGHDRRYAIDATRIQKELGWFPKETFETIFLWEIKVENTSFSYNTFYPDISVVFFEKVFAK